MTGQQLKNSILQLAIQGKLVAQNPDDEPASVLLAKIRKEKERLVKEGKLKKKDLVTTPISDEEKPFEIPKGWEWVRWGSLSFNIQYGYNAPALPNGDIRMVRISDIQNGEVQWSGVPFCNIKESDIDSYLLGQNDILFARTGGTVGKSFLVKDVPYPSIYAGYLIRTQYNSELLHPMYLKMFMESDIYWRQLKDGTIATAQPNCNGKTLSNMILPLPPLAEQHRIVERIEQLMPLVEKYGKAQEELEALNEALPERLRKSVLQEAIQGKLVPQNPDDEPASVLLTKIRKEKERLVKEGKLKKKDLVTTPISDEEKPFEIPKGWEWCRLKDVYTMQAGKTISSSELSQEKDDSHPYCCYGGNGIRGYINRYNNDGVYPIIGRQGALCGCVNMAKGKFHATEHAVVVSTFASTNETWAYYFLIALNLNQYATATAQPGLSVANILETFIPLPPLAEQRRIVEKLEGILSKINNL